MMWQDYEEEARVTEAVKLFNSPQVSIPNHWEEVAENCYSWNKL